MPVLWSAYQDVMPVFCLSASTSRLLTLEWLGTFDLVHAGSATVYTRRAERTWERTDLAEARAVETRRSAGGLLENLDTPRFTAAALLGEKRAVLSCAAAPHPLLLWDLASNTVTHLVHCTHPAPVLQLLGAGWGAGEDLLVTRDQRGGLTVLTTAAWQPRPLQLSPAAPRPESFLCLAADQRRLAAGGLGGLALLDFWSFQGAEK